jgi:hypothetical protein
MCCSENISSKIVDLDEMQFDTIRFQIHVYRNDYWDDIPPKLNSSDSCRVDPQHSNAIKISRVVSDIKYVDRQPPYYAFILYKEGMKSHSASF